MNPIPITTIVPSGGFTDSPVEDQSPPLACNAEGGGDGNYYYDDVAYHEGLSNRFPPGWRFCPSDVELIRDYLKRKVNGEELPSINIVEVNLYMHDPDTLTAKHRDLGEGNWYFFTPRERKYPNGDRPNRAAGDGYWKATGADNPIKWRGEAIGAKKSLVYHWGKPPRGPKSNWIMHEYKLLPSAAAAPRRPPRTDMRLDDFVLCRIYKKAGKYGSVPRRPPPPPPPASAAAVVADDQHHHGGPVQNSPLPPPPQQQKMQFVHHGSSTAAAGNVEFGRPNIKELGSSVESNGDGAMNGSYYDDDGAQSIYKDILEDIDGKKKPGVRGFGFRQ